MTRYSEGLDLNKVRRKRGGKIRPLSELGYLSERSEISGDGELPFRAALSEVEASPSVRGNQRHNSS